MLSRDGMHLKTCDIPDRFFFLSFWQTNGCTTHLFGLRVGQNGSSGRKVSAAWL
jgi:hypothetical protein